MKTQISGFDMSIFDNYCRITLVFPSPPSPFSDRGVWGSSRPVCTAGRSSSLVSGPSSVSTAGRSPSLVGGPSRSHSSEQESAVS